MKQITTIILCIILLLSVIASCWAPKRPLTVGELLDLGDKYLLELNYEQAIMYYTRVIEVEPNNVRACVGRGDAYAALQRYDEAISDYKRVIEIDPGILEVYIKLADVYIAIGETGQAMETLRSGLAAFPGNSEFQSRLDMLWQERNGLASDEAHDGAAETEIAINPPTIESSASQVSEDTIETTNPGEREMSGTADSADTLEAWLELTSFLGLPPGPMTIYDIPGISADAIARFEDGPGIENENGWIILGGIMYFVLSARENDSDYHFLVTSEGKVKSAEFTEESLQRLWGFSYGTTTKEVVLTFFENNSPESSPFFVHGQLARKR